MSKKDVSLDLSEFFNDDDSNGQRLAEFLQKRRGGGQPQQFLFVDFEPNRLSMNVQLEKIASVEAEEATVAGEGQNPPDAQPTVNTQPEAAAKPVELDLNCNPTEKMPISPSTSLGLSPRVSPIRKSGVSPGDRLRRYSLRRLSKVGVGRRTLLHEFENTVSDSNFKPAVFSTPMSQTLVAPEEGLVTPNSRSTSHDEEATKSGENSGHSKTLRSLQRKDKELRQMIESVVEQTIIKLHEKEKENPEKSILERGLQSLMTSKATSAEALASPLRPMNVLENRLEPSLSVQRPSCTSNQQIVPVVPQSPIYEPNGGNGARAPLSPRRANLSRSGRTKTNTTVVRKSLLQPEGNRTIVPSTPTKGNGVSATQGGNVKNSSAVPSEDVEIPETQELPAGTQQLIDSLRKKADKPLVVIPITQTFNGASMHGENIPNNNKECPVQPSGQNDIVSSVVVTEAPNGQCPNPNRISEFNLEPLCLTDDEDEQDPVRTSENSQAPLNLASSESGSNRTRLRKRSFIRRRVSRVPSHLLSTETETEMGSPPAAHALNVQRRRSLRRRKIPLNKAPSTPINGERFAAELARMTNYEILDLRKRISMERVLPVSGRRSSKPEDILKKQLQMENEIEAELLRRNVRGYNEKQTDKADKTGIPDSPALRTGNMAVEPRITRNAKKKSVESTINKTVAVARVRTRSKADESEMENESPAVENRTTAEEFPPVPDVFKDTVTAGEKENESALVDEKSCDRISFCTKKNERKQRQSQRSRRKEVPEVLKRYLDVGKEIRKNRTLNKSKRSLYTAGQSDSDQTVETDTTDKPNKYKIVEKDKEKSLVIPTVPLPPPVESALNFETSSQAIVPPPPPLSPSFGRALPQESIPPPPPAEFDTSRKKKVSHGKETSETLSMSTRNKQDTTSMALSDKEIFKKPLPPPPKKKGSKKLSQTETKNKKSPSKEDWCPGKGSSDNNSESNTSSGSETTLRRSKRGHVPLRNNWSYQNTDPTSLFQVLYREQLEKRLKIAERRQKKQKQYSSAASLGESSVQSTASSIASTRKNRMIPVLETLPEDEPVVLDSNGPEAKTKTKKMKVLVNKVKENSKQLECSHISLGTPPVEHLNNVFDQLRNASLVSEKCTQRTDTSAVAQSSSVKKLRVRVARLKNISHKTRGVHSDRTAASAGAPTTSAAQPVESNFELLSWLRSITDTEVSSQKEKIFKELRISSASNLVFTEVQGIDYAFYDTEDRASLGYLRFKPKQIKPTKRAKKYHLHFVTLVGIFRVSANDKISLVGPGDMFAIEKTAYYNIENTMDDIGILMVIKK